MRHVYDHMLGLISGEYLRQLDLSLQAFVLGLVQAVIMPPLYSVRSGKASRVQAHNESQGCEHHFRVISQHRIGSTKAFPRLDPLPRADPPVAL